MSMNDLPPELSPQALEVGRTHDMLGCVPVTIAVCRCEAKSPIVFQGCPSKAQCYHCGRTFRLLYVACDGPSVQTKIEVQEKTSVSLLGTIQ